MSVNTDSSVIRTRLTQKNPNTTLLFVEEWLNEFPFKRLRHLGISQRETEVLGWLMQGKSNPEIAGILGIGTGTVKTYLRSIFVILGVDHRQAAKSVALEALHSNSLTWGR